MNDIRDDPHAAVGAHVLHALPPDEEAAFLDHLAGCDACREEAAALARVVALLADVGEEPLPDDVRTRVLARIARTRQEDPAGPTPVPVRVRHRARRPLLLGLAASLAAAVALGGVAVWQHQEVGDSQARADRSDQRSAALADTLAAPDAALRKGALAGGGSGAVLVSRSQDRAAFIASGLPDPGKGRVHELWFADHGTFRPAGLLGDGGRQVRLLDGPVGRAKAVGITVEPAGGSKQPTTTPLGLIPLPV